jgi:hypothetical protein
MKVNQLKMIIREVVREEIRMGLKEIVGELNTKITPTENVKTVNKNYSKNSVLNDVLNETATSDEWKTMGGEKYTSDKMGEVMSSKYGKMVNDDSVNPNGTLAVDMGVDPNDPSVGFLKKDYRKVMKAIDKKQGK